MEGLIAVASRRVTVLGLLPLPSKTYGYSNGYRQQERNSECTASSNWGRFGRRASDWHLMTLPMVHSSMPQGGPYISCGCTGSYAWDSAEINCDDSQRLTKSVSDGASTLAIGTAPIWRPGRDDCRANRMSRPRCPGNDGGGPGTAADNEPRIRPLQLISKRR